MTGTNSTQKKDLIFFLLLRQRINSLMIILTIKRHIFESRALIVDNSKGDKSQTMKAKSRHNAKQGTPTTFGEFALLFPLLTDECRNKDVAILNEAEKPLYVCKREVADSFDMITFGQYSDLCDAMQESDHFIMVSKIIKAIYPDVTDEEINATSAYDAFGFSIFAVKEADKINKIFSSVKASHTSEEVAAGIDRLQFGTFGILDWYAKRMGITDQNEVFAIPWVRIYQCMANDTEEAEFSRRLQRVYIEKNKRHG